MRGPWNEGEQWEFVEDRDAQAAVDGGDGEATVKIGAASNSGQTYGSQASLEIATCFEKMPSAHKAGARRHADHDPGGETSGKGTDDSTRRRPRQNRHKVSYRHVGPSVLSCSIFGRAACLHL